MFNLEKAIKSWLKKFYKHSAFNHGAIREMELHLRDHIEDLLSEGKAEEEAFLTAVTEFGDIKIMAKEEYSNLKRKTTIRSIIYTHMFNNYFKTLFRGMVKRPLTSFINVFGLAVAIGICMVVYSFMNNDYSIDRFHTNKDHVFLTTFSVESDGDLENYGKSPIPLGEMLQKDFASIERVCRIKDGNVIMKVNDKVFNERIRFTDPEFLDMLTFPLKWGDASTLSDLNSIIISEEVSIKYFGDENPVGKNMLMKVDGSNKKTFKVAGVAKPFPKSHIIDFDFLVNFENLKELKSLNSFTDWKYLVDATLIQVDDPANIASVKTGMEKYKLLQNQVEKDWAIVSFDFVSINDLHLASGDIVDDISFDGTYEGRVTLPIIAIFMIMLACFNYINIAIVSASRRLKEIGLRKVIGANKKLVTIQFLTENLVITFFAGILGLVLAMSIFLPWFVDLADMPLELSLLDQKLWIFLLGTMIFTGLISGIYPAFYIAKFDVITIFKGSVKFGKKNTLTKVFLAVQLILACVGITGAVMFAQNSSYQASRSWGYNQHDALYAAIPDYSTYEQLTSLMNQNTDILSISGSEHHLANSMSAAVIHLPDRQYKVKQLSVDANYFYTMGLELIAGREFQKDFESEKNSIIINEMMAKDLGMSDPIGNSFKMNDISYEIIGIIKDFHFNNFYYEHQPTVFNVANKSDYQYISIKAKEGSQKDVYMDFQKNWATLYPETPFKGGYQEDAWGEFYEELGIMEKFTTAIAIIFVILTCLGLYGLVKLNIAGRIREFSIRKVLGADLKSIAYNVAKQYVLLSFIAILLGAPISYLLITANIDLMFPDPRPFGYSGVIISVFFLLSILVLVIATQIWKVLKSNPSEGLKVE